MTDITHRIKTPENGVVILSDPQYQAWTVLGDAVTALGNPSYTRVCFVEQSVYDIESQACGHLLAAQRKIETLGKKEDRLEDRLDDS